MPDRSPQRAGRNDRASGLRQKRRQHPDGSEIHHRVRERRQDARCRPPAERPIHVPLLAAVAGMAEGRPGPAHAVKRSPQRFEDRQNARLGNVTHKVAVVGQEIPVLDVLAGRYGSQHALARVLDLCFGNHAFQKAPAVDPQTQQVAVGRRRSVLDRHRILPFGRGRAPGRFVTTGQGSLLMADGFVLFGVSAARSNVDFPFRVECPNRKKGKNQCSSTSPPKGRCVPSP